MYIYTNTFIQQIQSISLISKYTTWYCDIIQTAKNRAVTKKEATILLGYNEKHHIIPKSFNIGGEKDKENYAYLTAREHFICHLLLSKMFSGNHKHKMVCAINKMMQTSKNQQRYIPTSRQYDAIRKEFSKSISALTVNVRRGPMSDCEKLKRSIALIGRPKSEITKLNMKAAAKLRDFSKSAEEKLAISVRTTKFWSDSMNKKAQSLARTAYLNANQEIVQKQIDNLNKLRFVCIHCNMMTNKGNFNRWHGTNCKLNTTL